MGKGHLCLQESFESQAQEHTLLTPLCLDSAAPVTPPAPWMMFRTPGGRPASSASSPMRSALSGVCSATWQNNIFPHGREQHAGNMAELRNLAGNELLHALPV